MLQALPSLFEAFGESRIEERYALVTFGSYREATINGVLQIYEGSTVDIPETRNPDDIMAVLEHMWDERPMLSGQTWIDAGLDDAVKVLTSDENREFAFKTVILVTDGEQFPKNGAHYPAAQRLAEKGITLHTIAYSLGAGSREMQDLAQIGGGKFFRAPSSMELVEAFKQLGSMAPVAIIE